MVFGRPGGIYWQKEARGTVCELIAKTILHTHTHTQFLVPVFLLDYTAIWYIWCQQPYVETVWAVIKRLMDDNRTLFWTGKGGGKINFVQELPFFRYTAF